MLANCRHGQPVGQSKQTTDTFGEGRVKARRPSVAAVRRTGDLASLSGSTHQPRKRRRRDALLFGHAPLGGPGQYLFHGPQIAMTLRTLGLWKRPAIKGRTCNGVGWQAG